MATLKLVPTGSMNTKNGNKLFFYFITAGPVKVQASSFNKELSNGDKVLLTKNGQYWNLQSATGDAFEVEVLNEVKSSDE